MRLRAAAIAVVGGRPAKTALGMAPQTRRIIARRLRRGRTEIDVTREHRRRRATRARAHPGAADGRPARRYRPAMATSASTIPADQAAATLRRPAAR